MAGYCLPRSLVAKFNSELRPGGVLDPIRLKNMTSGERKITLAGVLGDDAHAAKLNSLFEEKLLLKYKHGLEDWANEVITGPEDRKNIVDKISGIDARILDPKDQEVFLKDLAATRLKTKVTAEESQQIFRQAQAANELKDRWQNSILAEVSYRDFMNVRKGDTEGLSRSVIQTARDRIGYGNAVIDLRDYIESLKPNGSSFTQKLLNTAGQVLLLPKTLATGLLHFSAIGVQLWGSLSREEAYKGFLEQFKYFYDKDNYKAAQAYILSDPDYKYAVSARLGLTDVSDKVMNREESIPSSLAQDFNEWVAKKGGDVLGYGKPLPVNAFAASSRAFTGYLNYVRYQSFKSLLNGLRNVRPDDVSLDSQLVKDAASVVNNFTGRADLGNKGNAFAPVLNSLFFAPRKAAATAQMFSPIEYARLYIHAAETGNYAVANQALRNILGSLMITGSILYLVNASAPFGYSAGLNPLSNDFGKIIGPNGEKYDFTGGNSIWLRLVSRLITNKEVNRQGQTITLGQGYKATTRAELAERYARGKLSPVAGVVADWLAESTQIGQDPTLATEAKERLMPIVFENVLNYYYNQPDKTAADFPVLLGLLGVNVESPQPVPSSEGYTFWGDKFSQDFYNPTDWHDPIKNQLDERMNRLGMYERLPPKTINGIALNDDQYRDYVMMTGQLNKQRLGNLFSSETFNSLPVAKQRILTQNFITGSQRAAQARVIIDSLGSDNDILQKSLQAKRQKQGLE